MPPLWCGADASGGRPTGSPAGPAGLAPGRLDEHFRLSFEGGVQVSPPADPEASHLAGALAGQARSAAGQREIPLLPADSPAHEEDATDCGACYEDHDSDEEEGCGHDSSPNFWPPALVPPSCSYLISGMGGR